MAALFCLGRIVATPGALRLAQSGAFDPAELLGRHVCGDWGGLDAFDRRQNERALRSGVRIFSAYQTAQGGRVWIITEATDDAGARHSTCISPPSRSGTRRW
jgi:hypothetical protein